MKGLELASSEGSPSVVDQRQRSKYGRCSRFGPGYRGKAPARQLQCSSNGVGSRRATEFNEELRRLQGRYAAVRLVPLLKIKFALGISRVACIQAPALIAQLQVIVVKMRVRGMLIAQVQRVRRRSAMIEMRFFQRSGPNPSIEGTLSGLRPLSAPHVKR
jgi:hypothetical protein